MKRMIAGGLAAALVLFSAQGSTSGYQEQRKPDEQSAERPKKTVSLEEAVEKGLQWLAASQGDDGGWGQDGGAKSSVRSGERLESSANDVANTCLAALAMLRAGNTMSKGPHQESLKKAVAFVLRNVEQSPVDGLQITDQKNTQVQRKLGPYIDTFLASMLLSELDGNMADADGNKKVRQGLDKVVAKIAKNQKEDGSWNYAGGWAPIIGTSIASRSLANAQAKGASVPPATLAKVNDYTKKSIDEKSGGVLADSAKGEAAGVDLYGLAQAQEQLSRTKEDRKENDEKLKAIGGKLAEGRTFSGYGSMGGEEFFSYLNVSDSLRRTGGENWEKWNSKIKEHLLQLRNDDGTWSGHHCITGRVACTSAAIMTLLTEKAPVTIKPNDETRK